jgi:zinc protease
MIDSKTSAHNFETVKDDFLDVKKHTLSNGLTLFLSVNKDEPRIFTNIAVRAGSKHDPAETTGLAHYMEHMLFKGTSKIGTIDWEKEKEYLDHISELYELHRQTKEPEKKKDIYREIDRLSNEAAKLSAPNEYDKLASSVGAQKTNAYTWVEQTVYVNEIPSNELERWMELESERFRMMALRLFHTELETVYEEFNITQDNDYRKVNKVVRSELFPRHPYGTQTTIGEAEHLRNPSHVNIQRFFQTYYVPNNMAIVLAGDFNPDEAVQWAEQYFGGYEANDFPPFTYEEQPPIEQPVVKEVFGKEAPYVQLAWRGGSAQSKDMLFYLMISNLLYNDKAGLLDIHLNQQQKVLNASAYHLQHEDYSIFSLYGRPRGDQSLEEVAELMLEQIDKLKAGAFEDWLLEAIHNDMQLERYTIAESNQARVSALTNSYVLGISWPDFLEQLEDIKKITKEDIVAFAKENLGDNYVMAKKQQGEDPSVIKVEKPPITAIPLDRSATSDFGRSFLAKKGDRLSPVFVDYEKAIQQLDLDNGIRINRVKNPHEHLFRLDFIFEMGKANDLQLPIALTYLPYLGTSHYSPSELQQRLYRLGLSIDYYAGLERSYVSISGLEKSAEEGFALLEHLIKEAQPNAVALENVKADILTKRENAQQNRNFILRNGLLNYGKYGSLSPLSYKLKASELQQVQPEALITQIRQLFDYQHEVYYYGENDISFVSQLLMRHHKVNTPLKAVPEAKNFDAVGNPQNQVFVMDFPIVQTDVLMISKGTPQFDLEEYLYSNIYNDYFGYGLSSVVFQEIRESRALAYSTYAMNESPSRKDRPHFLKAYVGTQPDKLQEAIGAMHGIIKDMPMAESQLEHARQSILKKIESERVTPGRQFWEYKKNLDRGLRGDIRKELYAFIQDLKPEALLDFQMERIRNRQFNFMLLGDLKKLDMDYLSGIGPVKEISLEDVFGEK